MDSNEKIGGFPIGASLGILSVITAFSLFFGFLVVNIYLAQFGFWDFNFLRVDYITAGLLFMLFIGLPVGFSWLLDKSYASINAHVITNKSLPKRIAIRITKWVFKLIFLGIALYVDYFFFSIVMVAGSNVNKTFVTIESMIWFAVIMITTSAVRKSYRKVKAFKADTSSLREKIEHWVEIFKPVYYLPFVMLVILVAFSFLMYPLIPRYWGGGAETDIVIYLKNNTNLVSPLRAKLVYQSQDSLLINSSSSTYLLPTDQISDIQYLSSNPIFQKLLDGLKGGN